MQHGAIGTISWTYGEQPHGYINVRGSTNGVVFSYKITINGKDPKSIKHQIRIEWTPCHFGGSRPWFTCPKCQRRVGVLVGAGLLFGCRKCYDLPYACQRESSTDRASRRIRKIQKKLGNPRWQDTLDIWFPKPKGMHWKTHRRIVAQANKPLRTLHANMAEIMGNTDWTKFLYHDPRH